MAKGSVNKVIILGRLGQDPEMRATASGAQVATLSVATTELGRKDPQTNQRGPDETEWNRLRAIWSQCGKRGAVSKKRRSSLFRRAATH